MKRTYIKDLKEEKGEEVIINGWIDVRRDQGKMIFFDFRDVTGKVQGIILPDNKSANEIGSKVRPEWVVEVRCKVNERPERAVQKDKQNGDIEVEVLEMKVLNEAETPAFDISGDGKEINDEVRMTNRYVDLRRQRMQDNIRNRHKVTQFTRNYFSDNAFTEIETPYLTKSTPEGARDYVVPSRTEPGKFYALPQSPQQYKQMLMSSGFEKYFQIARCFRDEDTRGDRQPEFTQIDFEMSFVSEEDIIQYTEKYIIEMVKELYPDKKIQEVPFPRIDYKDSMEKYGNDRPDIREDKEDSDTLAFAWVVNFPYFEKNDKGGWTFTHNPFSSPKKEFIEDLKNGKNIEDIIAAQYDLVLNGYEIGGGSIRNHDVDTQKKVFDVMGYTPEQVENNFGHMLNALSSGTPPHGGFAFGFDRLMMILQGEPNIREVIAFPKTGEGRDLLMNSPANIEDGQLEELKISIEKEK